MNCKYCKYYEAGLDGKPGICTIPLGDIWNGFQNLEEDWIGVSVENYETDSTVLYVGETFGCIKFKPI